MSRTRNAAYCALKNTARAAAQVVGALAQSPKTRAEIAAATGLRLSSVCGRANELMTAGRIEVVGTKIDDSSNREVEVLAVTVPALDNLMPSSCAL